MKIESKMFLYDTQLATETVTQFTEGKTFADYTDDEMLRSAVERQIVILDGALNRMSSVDPETAGRIPESDQLIATRDDLIKNYRDVDHRVIWGIVTTQLPGLPEDVRQLLQENGDT